MKRTRSQNLIFCGCVAGNGVLKVQSLTKVAGHSSTQQESHRPAEGTHSYTSPSAAKPVKWLNLSLASKQLRKLVGTSPRVFKSGLNLSPSPFPIFIFLGLLDPAGQKMDKRYSPDNYPGVAIVHFEDLQKERPCGHFSPRHGHVSVHCDSVWRDDCLH